MDKVDVQEQPYIGRQVCVILNLIIFIYSVDGYDCVVFI